MKLGKREVIRENARRRRRGHARGERPPLSIPGKGQLLDTQTGGFVLLPVHVFVRVPR